MFQFQLGAIGSALHLYASGNTDQFQFQLGAIGSVILFITDLKIEIVSIPAWCDWEYDIFTFF